MDSTCANILNKLNLENKSHSKHQREKVLKNFNGWWNVDYELLYEKVVGEGLSPLISDIFTQFWFQCKNINSKATTAIYSGLLIINKDELKKIPCASLPPSFETINGTEYLIILLGATVHYNSSSKKYEITIPQFTNKTVLTGNFVGNNYCKISGIGYELTDPDINKKDAFVASIEGCKTKTPTDFIGLDFDTLYKEVYRKL